MRTVQVKLYGLREYSEVFQQMREFTDIRGADTTDEIWCMEHFPVYSLGLSANREHLLKMTDIPVINSDRGGQVTYHGPGQLVVYLLIDLKRQGLGVKKLVNRMEESVIKTLNVYGLTASRVAGAPGVYINGAKIAALGVRIRNGCCYHGLALNVDMDLSPFMNINPCGYTDLKVTQMTDFNIKQTVEQVARHLIPCIFNQFHYEPENAVKL